VRNIRAGFSLDGKIVFRLSGVVFRCNSLASRVIAASYPHTPVPTDANRTVKMACLSVTNALMAQRAAVRTNKRCVHVPGTINPPANFHVFRDAATGDG
jgi:hypothetical protein|tara:strand:- start:3379 stop:3675 length:297 start_codon:yes stop_codon:yes gene_type:complete